MQDDLQLYDKVWGEFASNHVWYPGVVKRGEDAVRQVVFDDGDVDPLDLATMPRRWRRQL